MADKLPVMESFLSIQGEGFHQGKLSYFIRLAGCDVGCPWCDVKESWPVNENQYRDIYEILSEIKSSPAKTVIITGGEPLIYDLRDFTALLMSEGYSVHIETSGAYEARAFFDWLTLSPKKFKKPVASIYSLAHELKAVIASKKDLEWAEEESLKVNEDCYLYLQAEWDRRKKQYPAIYSYITAHPKWKISLQTHKYLELP